MVDAADFDAERCLGLEAERSGPSAGALVVAAAAITVVVAFAAAVDTVVDVVVGDVAVVAIADVAIDAAVVAIAAVTACCKRAMYPLRDVTLTCLDEKLQLRVVTPPCYTRTMYPLRYEERKMRYLLFRPLCLLRTR